MGKILNILLFIISFIWQLPQNIVALVMLPFLGKLTFISYKKLCFLFKGSKMKGGISLGNFAFVSEANSHSKGIMMHEQEGHTFDSKLMGPLYIFIIGIPSILHAKAFHGIGCYYDFYTERWANKHAKVKVVKYNNTYYLVPIED